MVNPRRIIVNRRIPCIAPDGTEVTVLEYLNPRNPYPPTDSDAGKAGFTYFKTNGGRAVSPLDERTFQDVVSNEIMRIL